MTVEIEVFLEPDIQHYLWSDSFCSEAHYCQTRVKIGKNLLINWCFLDFVFSAMPVVASSSRATSCSCTHRDNQEEHSYCSQQDRFDGFYLFDHSITLHYLCDKGSLLDAAMRREVMVRIKP